MGRKPIGDRALTNAVKQRRYRQNLSAQRKYIKKKDKEHNKLHRSIIKVDPEKQAQ